MSRATRPLPEIRGTLQFFLALVRVRQPCVYGAAIRPGVERVYETNDPKVRWTAGIRGSLGSVSFRQRPLCCCEFKGLSWSAPRKENKAKAKGERMESIIWRKVIY